MRLVAFFVLFLALAPVARAQEFADWTALSNANTVLSGTLLGAPVTVTGGAFHPASPLDGSSTEFSGADFSPPLARSDAPELFGTNPASTYTIRFGAPVRDPILHFFSLASTVTFEANVTRRSGQLSVSGATINGTFPDVSGSVQLSGDYEQIVLSTLWTMSGQPDGIDFQVGGERVPAVTPTPTPTPTPTVAPPPPPPPPVGPVSGVRVITTVAAGEVLIKGTGGAFVPLGGTTPVSVGATVDARRGSLDLTSDTGTARLAAGIFTIRQTRDQPPEFVLATPAGLERACAPGRKPPPKGIVRTLKVVAKGVFRTVPKKGIVTGRNASWTTSDTCKGSLVTVQRGSVRITLGRKAIRIKKGQRHLLKARLFGART